MAIEIREITSADNFSQLVDKINFNFDQITLAGGGLPGKGNPGLRGKKGERGSIRFTKKDLIARVDFNTTDINSNAITVTEGTIIVNQSDLVEPKGNPNRYYPAYPNITTSNTDDYNSNLTFNANRLVADADTYVQDTDDTITYSYVDADGNTQTFTNHQSKKGDIWQYDIGVGVWLYTGVNIRGEKGDKGDQGQTQWERTDLQSVSGIDLIYAEYDRDSAGNIATPQNSVLLGLDSNETDFDINNLDIYTNSDSALNIVTSGTNQRNLVSFGTQNIKKDNYGSISVLPNGKTIISSLNSVTNNTDFFRQYYIQNNPSISDLDDIDTTLEIRGQGTSKIRLNSSLLDVYIFGDSNENVQNQSGPQFLISGGNFRVRNNPSKSENYFVDTNNTGIVIDPHVGQQGITSITTTGNSGNNAQLSIGTNTATNSLLFIEESNTDKIRSNVNFEIATNNKFIFKDSGNNYGDVEFLHNSNNDNKFNFGYNLTKSGSNWLIQNGSYGGGLFEINHSDASNPQFKYSWFNNFYQSGSSTYTLENLFNFTKNDSQFNTGKIILKESSTASSNLTIQQTSNISLIDMHLGSFDNWRTANNSGVYTIRNKTDNSDIITINENGNNYIRLYSNLYSQAEVLGVNNNLNDAELQLHIGASAGDDWALRNSNGSFYITNPDDGVDYFSITNTHINNRRDVRIIQDDSASLEFHLNNYDNWTTQNYQGRFQIRNTTDNFNILDIEDNGNVDFGLSNGTITLNFDDTVFQNSGLTITDLGNGEAWFQIPNNGEFRFGPSASGEQHSVLWNRITDFEINFNGGNRRLYLNSGGLLVDNNLNVNSNGFIDGHLSVGGGNGYLDNTQESAYQSESNYANDGFVEAPWIYAAAIEAVSERGGASTFITIGDIPGSPSDPNFTFTNSDQIGLHTNGQLRFLIESGTTTNYNDFTNSGNLEVNGHLTADSAQFNIGEGLEFFGTDATDSRFGSYTTIPSGQNGDIRMLMLSDTSTTDGSLIISSKNNNADYLPIAEFFRDNNGGEIKLTGFLDVNGRTDVSGRAVIGNISDPGESDAQSNSNVNNNDYVVTPWVYTNVIEANSETGANSTFITLGNLGLSGDYSGFDGSDKISFITDGDEQVHIDGEGLRVEKDATVNGDLDVNGTIDVFTIEPAVGAFYIRPDNGTTNNQFRFNDLGRFYIYKDSDSYTYMENVTDPTIDDPTSVEGFQISVNDPNNFFDDGNFFFSKDGDFWAESSYNSSDINLKENINELSNKINIKNSLKEIKPKHFKRKSRDEYEIGLIAQDVEKYIPELVKTRNKIKSLDYSKFTAVLLGGIQDLYSENEELKKENQDLKDRLEKIEKHLGL